jgi:hypothetical protein
VAVIEATVAAARVRAIFFIAVPCLIDVLIILRGSLSLGNMLAYQ